MSIREKTYSIRQRLARALLGWSLLYAVNAGAGGLVAPPAPALREAAASQARPVEALPTELAHIGDAVLEFHRRQTAQPHATLVFENGLQLPLETWSKVLEGLGDQVNVLLYNRPGVGRSAMPDSGDDPTQTTRRLKALLAEQGLHPPYILVGHSMGGLYAQQFARLYPEQVSALLLVDALPPGALKPYAEFPWLTRVGLRWFAPPQVLREVKHASIIGGTLLAEPGRFAGPVTRLLAETPQMPKPQGLIKDLLRGTLYAEDFGITAMDPDAAEAQVAAIYPHSTLLRVRSFHRVQELAPQAVVAAIRDIMGRFTVRSP
ncbi:alpha/beta hydrolase [Paucibacter sp. APW11]|uniref:Alpha/beta hydrolase n=1 Tax=Roseateles aquae TaxID=3077235 RepID=A0ABU3PGT7_9BURK|nr:alpha/beta hydrolase [Paucibacter sp. APW11]MDT9001800.1 alpha/beta hydrolase [Paucibacter sp. APW11]